MIPRASAWSNGRRHVNSISLRPRRVPISLPPPTTFRATERSSFDSAVADLQVRSWVLNFRRLACPKRFLVEDFCAKVDAALWQEPLALAPPPPYAPQSRLLLALLSKASTTTRNLALPPSS